GLSGCTLRKTGDRETRIGCAQAPAAVDGRRLRAAELREDRGVEPGEWVRGRVARADSHAVDEDQEHAGHGAGFFHWSASLPFRPCRSRLQYAATSCLPAQGSSRLGPECERTSRIRLPSLHDRADTLLCR